MSEILNQFIFPFYHLHVFTAMYMSESSLIVSVDKRMVNGLWVEDNDRLPAHFDLLQSKDFIICIYFNLSLDLKYMHVR